MKTTEMDVKKNVLEELIALMEGKMLGSMKSEPEDEDAASDAEDEPKVKGLSISVVDTKKLDDDEEDEDPLQAKLKKLFSKE